LLQWFISWFLYNIFIIQFNWFYVLKIIVYSQILIVRIFIFLKLNLIAYFFIIVYIVRAYQNSFLIIIKTNLIVYFVLFKVFILIFKTLSPFIDKNIKSRFGFFSFFKNLDGRVMLCLCNSFFIIFSIPRNFALNE